MQLLCQVSAFKLDSCQNIKSAEGIPSFKNVSLFAAIFECKKTFEKALRMKLKFMQNKKHPNIYFIIIVKWYGMVR